MYHMKQIQVHSMSAMGTVQTSGKLTIIYVTNCYEELKERGLFDRIHHIYQLPPQKLD